ncbi:MAG: glutamate--tRNA ligase [Sphingopyxis sp.]
MRVGATHASVDLPSASGRPVVTRFAPSPTGFLHIGGARTALFNWLYAKRTGGKFLLRIEDTDRARSSEAANAAILDGMTWLGLEWDGDVVFQFARAPRHAEVAHSLLAAGHAYRCYLTAEELAEMRATAQAEKRPFRIVSPWRDADAASAPADKPAVVRLKAPRDGKLTIIDRVQGEVTVDAGEIDDFVLLRSDGTPTYMLSVVVDDNDMGVTHVIRGDDHLNNAFRQLVLLRAMGWAEPVYAHVPLIHGGDGAKLSKRHGALGVDAYRDEMGYLPEAVNNYLLRLGWGHGDEEIINQDQAIAWFDVDDVGRSASRFDFKKLENLNGHYMREADDARLTALAVPHVERQRGAPLSPAQQAQLLAAMPSLKPRAKNLVELADGAMFLYEQVPLAFEDKARGLIDSAPDGLLDEMLGVLAGLDAWTMESLDAALRQSAERRELGLGKIAQPLRAALTGRATSPGIFDVLFLLGRDEALQRIKAALSA